MGMACGMYGGFHTMTRLVGKPEVKRLLDDLGIDGRIILNAS
jgi:hypothetical protein